MDSSFFALLENGGAWTLLAAVGVIAVSFTGWLTVDAIQQRWRWQRLLRRSRRRD